MSGSGPVFPILKGVWQSLQAMIVTRYRPPPKLEGGWLMAGAATNTAWAGPWGISYTANLTPDQNTGIGIWTEDMFIKSMRDGKHMGTSRTILPPMPWPWYAQMRDEELKAIFAYLKSIPPIRNHVPDPTPPS